MRAKPVSTLSSRRVIRSLVLGDPVVGLRQHETEQEHYDSYEECLQWMFEVLAGRVGVGVCRGRNRASLGGGCDRGRRPRRSLALCGCWILVRVWVLGVHGDGRWGSGRRAGWATGPRCGR